MKDNVQFMRNLIMIQLRSTQFSLCKCGLHTTSFQLKI